MPRLHTHEHTMLKAQCRKKLLQERQDYMADDKTRLDIEKALCERLITAWQGRVASDSVFYHQGHNASPIQKKVKPVIGIYAAMRGEPDLSAFYQVLMGDALLALPFINEVKSIPDAPKDMNYRALIDPHAIETIYHWPKNHLGIQQPPLSMLGDIVQPTIVLVPCVGWHRDGGRLGYGGGYFDRYIAAHRLKNQSPPVMIAIGIALDEAEIGDSFVEAHDEKLDWVVTPTQMIKP